ncbi:PREDICTED: transforming growth factor-beta receptor-associated protein 1 isoform X2 [Tarenaya hassleriana]|uniref:transforming growth factor-beta receptor-associated protein 1 isoform X2 n=1 Tax=Tarenaya hassleriana TaxID=28532 RepID=UPI00053C22C7|nr:PREDICTED: transforming growth factor-beta receptor-associated protein 1 isoform X2 [Tarenaya hassleriana]
MAKSRPVLELAARFDLGGNDNDNIRALSLCPLSDSQTLVYVGTFSGSLFLLSFDASSNAVSRLGSVWLGVSPVESIYILDQESGKVLVLCDGYLFLVDSLLAKPAKRLDGALKGIDVVARRFTGRDSVTTDLLPSDTPMDQNKSSSKKFFQMLGTGNRVNGIKSKDVRHQRAPQGNCVFAVSIGERMLLIELLCDEKDGVSGPFVILKELPGFTGVKSMVWLDDFIIAGTIHGYNLASCVTGQSGMIFALPDVSGSPLLKLLCKEWKVLLLVDNVGVIVDANGQPVGGSLVFRRRPDSVGELCIDVVAVGDGKMEIYQKNTGICVQSVTFGPEGCGQSVLAAEESGNGSIVAVASLSKLIFYQKVAYEEQIKDLLRKKNYREAISLVEELDLEGEISKEMLSFVHAQVPRNRYWGLHPPPVPLEDVVDNGLMSIQRAIFLRKAGVEIPYGEEFLSNPSSRADLLESAIKNVTRYLEISREKKLALPVMEGIDTLLILLYRALNRIEDMEKLASTDNYCVVEELETLLNESGHLRTLAFLYANKGMSAEALSIWRLFARNYSSGLWQDSHSVCYILDGEPISFSGREAAAAEASRILEESCNQDLVSQHLSWIADINSSFGIQVLTSDKRTEDLSPEQVIQAIDPKKVEILQRYLQWLIEDRDCNDPQLHTLYALSLAKSALECMEVQNNVQEGDAGGVEVENCNANITSMFQSYVRERLQTFLQSSDLYNPEEILDLVEGSELWLEKAILYRKLGQETLVLQILALKLEDCEAAEQYCVEIGRPDAFMQLLDMYLDPQVGKEPMFKAAVRLLHNHGESLDPLQVLEKLSPDIPLKLASDTILRMLRARVHHHRQGQIARNISRALDVDSRLARLEERSRHVQINDASLCDSCHARLGTKLFAMYPDDTIICYKCYRRLGESTSVTGRDFKQDILIKPGWLVNR